MIGELPAKFAEAVKGIFIPEEGYIDGKIEYLKNQIMVAFGIGAYDMSSMFSSETTMKDIKITLYGHTMTICSMKFVMKALGTFRPIIRGFIVLMMIFYNINQLLICLGFSPVTLGSLHTSEETGVRVNDN